MVVMASSSPATATRSWPARATGVEPKTGAAMYTAPREVRWVETEVVVEGWTVVVSTMSLSFKRGPSVDISSTMEFRVLSSLTWCEG